MAGVFRSWNAFWYAENTLYKRCKDDLKVDTDFNKTRKKTPFKLLRSAVKDKNIPCIYSEQSHKR